MQKSLEVWRPETRDRRGQIRHSFSVLEVEVRLGVGAARVVVDPYDYEGRVGPVGAVFEHERGQVCRARVPP